MRLNYQRAMMTSWLVTAWSMRGPSELITQRHAISLAEAQPRSHLRAIRSLESAAVPNLTLNRLHDTETARYFERPDIGAKSIILVTDVALDRAKIYKASLRHLDARNHAAPNTPTSLLVLFHLR